MEQNQNSSLFGLTIDPASKSHLTDIARWAKFVAIVGFIMCVMTVIFGFGMQSSYSQIYNSRYEGFDRDVRRDTETAGTIMAVWCFILAVIYFFPFLFLFQFSSKMRSALEAGDQDTLNNSFQKLKNTLRYVGVLMIILLLFFIFILLAIWAVGAVRPR